jgi:hypothetical protein
MSPSAIEATLQTETSLLAHVCVLGAGHPYNVALVTADPSSRATCGPPADCRRHRPRGRAALHREHADVH